MDREARKAVAGSARAVRRRRFGVAASLCAVLALAGAASAQSAIKLATVVPQGSIWDKNLKQMADEWKEATGGRVSVTVFSGGSQGDESTVLRKMRLDALQASALHRGRPRHHRLGVQRLRHPVFLRLVRRAELRHRQVDAGPAQAHRAERLRAAQLGARRLDAGVHEEAGADDRRSQARKLWTSAGNDRRCSGTKRTASSRARWR